MKKIKSVRPFRCIRPTERDICAKSRSVAELAALRKASADANVIASAPDCTGTNGKKKKQKTQKQVQFQVDPAIPNNGILDILVASPAGPSKLTLRSVLDGTSDAILSAYLFLKLISDTLLLRIHFRLTSAHEIQYHFAQMVHPYYSIQCTFALALFLLFMSGIS